MIRLNMLPCANCRFYSEIKQPNKSEINEYVACNKAKTKNAKELLYFAKSAYSCEEYKEKERELNNAKTNSRQG